MFDTLLESGTAGAQVRSRWAFPIAVMSHVTLIATLVAASLLVTVSLKEPPREVVLDIVTAVPLPPPRPPLPRGSTIPSGPQRAEESEPDKDEPLQPDAIPETPPPIYEDESGTAGEGESGVQGVRYGDPNGVLGGDPNGVPHGVLEGAGTSLADRAPTLVMPGMTPPVLRRKVEPEYPETARAARLPGRVILQAVISAEGRVEDVIVLRSSNPLFDDAAIDAVKQWEYEPARQGDRPVAVYFTIDVRFTLR